MLALDKPGGWMLAPDSWDRTGRNLHLALQSSLNAGDFWARSRGLKYLRFVHRLDAETTGITLFAKSPGVLRALSEIFEEREVEKYYWAVVHGIPKQPQWTCDAALMPDPGMKGRMKTVPRPKLEKELAEGNAKEAETRFRVLKSFLRKRRSSKRVRSRDGRIRFACTWRRRGIPSSAIRFTVRTRRRNQKDVSVWRCER